MTPTETALAAMMKQMEQLTGELAIMKKSVEASGAKNRTLLAEAAARRAPSPKQAGKQAAKPNRDPDRTKDRDGNDFSQYYTREDEDKYLDAMDEQEAFTARMAANTAFLDGKPAPGAAPKLPAHHISRADAADGTKYRAARAASEAAGVPLQIVGDTPDYTPYGHSADGPRPTLRTFDDRTSGLRWVRSDAMPNGRIRAAQVARAAGLTLRVFSTTDELDDGAREVYAEAGGE